MTTTTEEMRQYLGPRLDVLQQCIANRDGDGVVGIVTLIRDEGHPQVADYILDRMLDAGMRSLAEGGAR
jgi:hypothetical protein